MRRCKRATPNQSTSSSCKPVVIISINNSNATAGGFYSENNGDGVGIYSINTATGIGIVSNGITGSSGAIYEGRNNGITTYSVTKEGNATANSFIKSGGTSSQYLMADGSVSAGGGGGSDDQTASEVPFTPYSTIASTNVQDAIEEVLDEIPTSLAAANITVSPSIGGNTDAYAVMLANRTSIDSIQANMAGGVNTAYRTVTYSSTISEAYDEIEPNMAITLTGDIDLTITGTENGDSGFLMLRTTSTHAINLNGLTDLTTTGGGGTMYFAYMHDVDGLEWYRVYKEAPKPKAEVVTSATIAMDGYKMYNDQTADAGTITLSDCQAGETLTVYINRASAPNLAGSGLTFNQLPNTTPFAAATEMAIFFEVAYDGTTIDYFYYER